MHATAGVNNFNALVTDPLLCTLYGCTTSLHRITSYVHELVQERYPFTKYQGSVPPRLSLMRTFTDRIVSKINATPDDASGTLHDLKHVAHSMSDNIAKATHQWYRRDAMRMRVLTGKLQSASYVSKGLVVEAGNQVISDEKKKIVMNNEISGCVTSLIRIALNLSESHCIGERSVNIISDIKFRKNGTDLVKALINAISFAYRDMHEKEYTRFESPRMNICAKMNRNGMLEIEVDDNGIGLKYDILRKIYEKDLIIKHKNGSGTGLYQCQHLVTRIGGTMDVKSTYEKGVTTTIIVPNK